MFPDPFADHRLARGLLRALILAAGSGRRLWPYTASQAPKCLLSVGPATILEHQLLRLAAVGVSHVTVVAGFGFQAVRQRARCSRPDSLSVAVVYNPFYAVADNLISLWSARSEMATDFILVNGDTVFHPRIPELLIDGEVDACRLLVCRKSDYDEDDMKVCLSGDRLVRIGKDLCPQRAGAESIGMMRFSGEGVCLLRRVLEDAVQGDGALRSLYFDGVQRLVDAGCPVRCRDVGRLPWADVDTPQDLLEVRQGYQRYTDSAGQELERGRA